MNGQDWGKSLGYDDIVWAIYLQHNSFIIPELQIQINIFFHLHQFVKIKFSAVVRPVLMTDVCVFVCENGVLSILLCLICKSRWNGACGANCKQAGEMQRKMLKKTKKIRKILKGKENMSSCTRKIIKKTKWQYKKVRYSIDNKNNFPKHKHRR